MFEMDPVRREPKIRREMRRRMYKAAPASPCIGPRRQAICSRTEDRFVQTVCNFTTFNPHLTIRARWNEREFLDFSATDREWRKWRTCDPTSAHWYGAEQFERYMAAHISRDEDLGRSGRKVRDFISELRGLARSGKQKRVLAETCGSGVSLATFFEGGRSAIAALLTSCQRHTKPVPPEALGLIGAEHLLADCAAVGAGAESFRYRKHLGTTQAGFPYAIETAVAYCRDEPHQWRLVTGVNFSVGIGSPFERLGPFYGLASVLGRQHVSGHDPVVLIVHYTCPHVDFADRGKGTLALPREVADDIVGLVEADTKDWAKQRRAELRSATAEAKRSARLLRQRLRPEKQGPPEPSGLLAANIFRAASEVGTSIDALVVLSPATTHTRRGGGVPRQNGLRGCSIS